MIKVDYSTWTDVQLEEALRDMTRTYELVEGAEEPDAIQQCKDIEKDILEVMEVQLKRKLWRPCQGAGIAIDTIEDGTGNMLLNELWDLAINTQNKPWIQAIERKLYTGHMFAINRWPMVKVGQMLMVQNTIDMGKDPMWIVTENKNGFTVDVKLSTLKELLQ